MNTRQDKLSSRRLNILLFFLFGWLFLLIGAAFTKRADFCADYGEVSRYRTKGSWIAMVILILLVLLVVAGMFGGRHH
jgi:hypothetical protein